MIIECQHGQLMRSCPHCEAEQEIKGLREEAESLAQLLKTQERELDAARAVVEAARRVCFPRTFRDTNMPDDLFRALDAYDKARETP
jgi:hypothetical protein